METPIYLLTINSGNYRDEDNDKIVIPDKSEATVLKAINKLHNYDESHFDANGEQVYFLDKFSPFDGRSGGYRNTVEWRDYFYNIIELKVL